MSRPDIKKILLAVSLLFGILPRLEAATKSVTMAVGETKTFSLPSSVTSLNLRSCYFYSTSLEYVAVKSYTTYSVTIEAKKPTTSIGSVIVRCDYKYLVSNGSYNYQATGYFDFVVTVVGKAPTAVSLPTTETIYVGESKVLNPTVYPSDAYVEYSWSSSAYSTINVDKNGKILAQKTGSSVITVKTQNGLSASCTVTAIYKTVDPTSISLSQSSLTLVVGKSIMLTATIVPSDATDKTISWSSLYPDVASVNAGKVTALKTGQTVITAMTANGLWALCKVNCVLPTLKISGDSELTSVPLLANVEYSRSFLKGWNSLCVPFGLSQDELDKASGLAGCRIATLKEAKAASLLFEFAEAVEGGTPCLVFFPEDATVTIKRDSVSLATSPKSSSLIKGSYTTKVIGPGYYKLTPDGTAFGLTTADNATVKAMRIYVKQQ